MPEVPLEGPRRRDLVLFSRLLKLYLDHQDDTRKSINAMACRVGDQDLDRPDTDDLLQSIECLLFGDAT